MISFIIALCALLVGYLIYGRVIEKIFGPDDRETPAKAMADGVDFVALPNWKIFMIQFLNIAGTGPIFGAIMGAWYGPSAYLWIVLGSIFAGAVHDYMTGMISMRNKGAELPEIVGLYLGKKTQKVVVVFSLITVIMVGVVFVFSPAVILANLWGSRVMWVAIIFLYYILATLLPIDKVIARIYPIFAFSLLFMALALMAVLFIKMPDLPEIWSNLSDANKNVNPAWLDREGLISSNPLFPCMFITIACGAISGFHATQTPLMARCLVSERQGRPIFYGAMITEGVVALIWATVSMYFFYYGGWREVCPPEVVNAFIEQVDGGKNLRQFFEAPAVVNYICTGWLGLFGGILALFGVVAAPITSGDTAFRSARLIIADHFHINQTKVHNRMLVGLPLFLASFFLLLWQINDSNGFNIIWQYFGLANQTISVFTLWTFTVYFVQQRKPFIQTLIPALFMTAVTTTFLFISKQGLGLPHTIAYSLGAVVLVIALVWFFSWYRKATKSLNTTE